MDSGPDGYTLTSAEAAKRLGVDVSTLGRYARERRVPHLATLGGHRRYRPSDIDALIAGLESRAQVPPNRASRPAGAPSDPTLGAPADLTEAAP